MNQKEIGGLTMPKNEFIPNESVKGQVPTIVKYLRIGDLVNLIIKRDAHSTVCAGFVHGLRRGAVSGEYFIDLHIENPENAEQIVEERIDLHEIAAVDVVSFQVISEQE